MDVNAAVSIIVAGAALPFLAAIFTNPKMTGNRKRLIVGALSLVLGTLLAIANGMITEVPERWTYIAKMCLIYVAGIVTLSQGVYKLFLPVVKEVEGEAPRRLHADDV